MQVLVATTNQGKLREIKSILSILGLELLGLEASAATDDIEVGVTYQENALLKARHYHGLSGLPTLADDSGLEVAALGGRPGIHSARYGGRDASDAIRIAKLLRELTDVPAEAREARFICSAAVVWDGGERTFTELVPGQILTVPRGESGFGYDPIFLYDPLGKTFAELTPVEKAGVSHRALAFQNLSHWWSQWWGRTVA